MLWETHGFINTEYRDSDVDGASTINSAQSSVETFHNCGIHAARFQIDSYVERSWLGFVQDLVGSFHNLTLVIERPSLTPLMHFTSQASSLYI